MTTMGRHSPPIDGIVTANGRALEPFTIRPLQQAGPVSVLPQPDDPGQSRTADEPGRWRHAVSAFRRNWWRLVFASVGAVAAVVSYGHIVNLFLTWHAPLLDARLMPVAIDGLIIIGAGAARGGQKWLGWSAIGPGLAASLYANVMNGLPHGLGPAMGSGWATVALFLATNVMERWEAVPAVQPREDKPADRQADKQPDKPAPRRAIPGRTALDKPRTALDKAADAIRRHPDWAGKKEWARLAESAGVSAKTIQRARNAGSKT
jgi:hypothetical protein